MMTSLTAALPTAVILLHGEKLLAFEDGTLEILSSRVDAGETCISYANRTRRTAHGVRFIVIDTHGVREIVKHGKTTAHVVNHVRMDLRSERTAAVSAGPLKWRDEDIRCASRVICETMSR